MSISYFMKSGLELLDEFINAIDKKVTFPKKVDWSKEFYERYD